MADTRTMMEWLRQRFELARASAGLNVRPMEGMRGFAVTLVFLTHYCTLGAGWVDAIPDLKALAHTLHAIGNAGVDLFFVLSGYLIYKTLVAREQRFHHFMARRIERIYPTFLVVFAAYCALSFLFPQQSRIPADAPLTYLFQNLLLLPGVFPLEPMITVAWSLSYEMFFYLLLPLVVWAFALRRRSAGWRFAGVALIAFALAVYFSRYDAAYGRMLMFLAGMLLHESIASRAVRAPSAGVAALALVLALAGGALDGIGYGKTGLLFAGFYVLCLHCFLRPHEWLARAFSWTPLRWLGNMSYSYYLVHGLVLKFLFMVFARVPALAAHGGAAFVGLLLPSFAVTLAGAALLFLVVERPLSLRAAKVTVAAQPSSI